MSIWDMSVMGCPSSHQLWTCLQGPGSQVGRQFLQSPKQGEHCTCRVRAKQSLFQGYFILL